MPKTLYLIDGSGYIFRAFHALPPLTRSDGTPIGAVLGFTNMLLKLREDLIRPGDECVVIFDAGRATFRSTLYPAYKANRLETPEELIPQFPLVRTACTAFNFPQVELKGFEADDLIATYTKLGEKQNLKTVIVSSDKDLMQLVTETSDRVRLWDPLKGKLIGPAEVFDKFGVAPSKVADVQALAGDTSDNIPGVPGIGVKTAALLINTFGSVQEVLDRAAEIPQQKRRESLIAHREDALISARLVRLDAAVSPPLSLEAMALPPIDLAQATEFCNTQGFHSLLRRLAKKAEANGVPLETFATEGHYPLPATTSPVPIATATYQLIQDLETLQNWVKTARQKPWVAIDTETTSLDPLAAELVGISLSSAPGEGLYIPFIHTTHAQGPQTLGFEENPPEAFSGHTLDRAAVFAILKPLLEDPAVIKVGHHMKYDLLVLQKYAVQVMPFEDTMLLSYVLGAGLHGHGLDELAERFLDHKMITFKEVMEGQKAGATFDAVPLDRACQYAAEDADMTGQLYTVLRPKVIQNHLMKVYATLELPLVPVLMEMEAHGILIDPKLLKSMSHTFEKRLHVVEEKIYDLAGHPFNIGSPKQLGTVLFDELKLPGAKKNKSGGFQTHVDILDALYEETGAEIAGALLEWRTLSKLKTTYTDALPREISPIDGRVHTSFSMSSTLTGRLASSKPNLQNIPIRTEEGREIRAAFIAPSGSSLISFDYSQIELRLLAEVASIETLREAFHNNLDIHALTASEIFHIPLDQVTANQRREAKTINFGIIYGMSPFGLSKQLGIPQAQAKTYIDLYFQHYPGIQAYMEKSKNFARVHGYVETLFGRRCHIPNILSRNGAAKQFAERQAINAPLQGSAADIMRLAMIAVHQFLKTAPFPAKLLLQIHDELVLEVPDAHVEACIQALTPILENTTALSVPLKVGVGHGKSWAEAH